MHIVRHFILASRQLFQNEKLAVGSPLYGHRAGEKKIYIYLFIVLGIVIFRDHEAEVHLRLELLQAEVRQRHAVPPVHVFVLVLRRPVDHQQAVQVHQDAAAGRPLPLPVVLGRRENGEDLGPLAQGDPLRVRLVRADDVAELPLGQEVVDGLRSETDRSASPQTLSEPRLADGQLLLDQRGGGGGWGGRGKAGGGAGGREREKEGTGEGGMRGMREEGEGRWKREEAEGRWKRGVEGRGGGGGGWRGVGIKRGGGGRSRARVASSEFQPGRATEHSNNFPS